MNIPKWIRKNVLPIGTVSKIEMVNIDLNDAEGGVRSCIDAIENVKPTCLKGDKVKINTLSRRLGGLIETRDMLCDIKRATIIKELSKFPIDTPCTLHTISTTIGIVDYEIKGAMFRTSHPPTRKDVDNNYPEFKHPVYTSCISPCGTVRLEDRSDAGERYIYNKWRVSEIKIGGWRFVESEYGHVYLERIS